MRVFRGSPLHLTLFMVMLLSMSAVVPRVGAQPRADDGRFQALPILVANCETDPGSLTAADRAGDAAPWDEHGCVPAEGVAVSAHAWEHNWHGRCDTDAAGRCELNGPAGSDIEVIVSIHRATIAPGYEPVAETITTAIQTEFAGAEFVNLPVATDSGTEPTERQTLALNVASCAAGTGPDPESCERSPVADAPLHVGLPGVDEDELDIPWLVTNPEGWVSFDISEVPPGEVIIGGNWAEEQRIACTDLGTGERILTEWDTPDLAATAFVRMPLDTDADIRCDITVG